MCDTYHCGYLLHITFNLFSIKDGYPFQIVRVSVFVLLLKQQNDLPLLKGRFLKKML